MARPVDERRRRLRALQRQSSEKKPTPLPLEERIAPAWPPEAFYFRRYMAFEDALRAYAANHTPPSWAGVKMVKAHVWLPDKDGLLVRRGPVEAIRAE